MHKISKGNEWRLIPILVLVGSTCHAATEGPSAVEVVKQCYYKNQGQDQRTTLNIVIKSPDGKEINSEFLRLWKDYSKEATDFEEKMLLYTVAPKESRGVNYMRWSYRSTIDKPPEQWVYLPELQKTRRVSQRDPYDMSWGLTDEDFRVRLLDEDKHTLTKTEKEAELMVYTVESHPKTESVYSRWITRYVTPGSLEDCYRDEVKYYDKANKLLKRVRYKWRRIDDVWVWDDVAIENNKTLTTVSYRTQKAAVNVGLSDKDFTEREIKRAPSIE